MLKVVASSADTVRSRWIGYRGIKQMLSGIIEGRPNTFMKRNRSSTRYAVRPKTTVLTAEQQPIRTANAQTLAQRRTRDGNRVWELKNRASVVIHSAKSTQSRRVRFPNVALLYTGHHRTVQGSTESSVTTCSPSRIRPLPAEC